MDIKRIPPLVIPYSPVIPGIMSQKRVAGQIYGALGVSGNVSVSTAVINKIYATPFLVLEDETFDRIAIYCNNGAAGNARLGIYANTDGYPSNLILDAGAVDTTDSGSKAISINQALSPGLYWLVALFSGTPGISAHSSSINLLGLSAAGYAYLTTQEYGELPATHPTPAPSTALLPFINLRRA